MSDIKAKPLLEDRMWILEQNGKKFGALQKAEDGYTVIRQEKKEKFYTPEELKRKYSISFEKPMKEEKRGNVIYDFPCSTEPHNDLYDVQNKVPIYTEDEKSKSYFCAGYYLVNTGKWELEYCPKLIMVQRYPFKGPYKTEAEAHEAFVELTTTFNDFFE